MKANEHPRVSIFKKGGIVILAVFMLGLIYLTAPGFAGAVPRCENGNVVALTERLVADVPAFRLLGTAVSIRGHTEVSYNEEADIRRCSATLVTPLAEERVFFEISWHDKMAGEIWVEFQDYHTGREEKEPKL